jgi:hypothetical protein
MNMEGEGLSDAQRCFRRENSSSASISRMRKRAAALQEELAALQQRPDLQAQACRKRSAMRPRAKASKAAADTGTCAGPRARRRANADRERFPKIS